VKFANQKVLIYLKNHKMEAMQKLQYHAGSNYYE
jgi:hypothetical protein